LLLLDKRGLVLFRRYVLSSWIALATVIISLVYKIAVIG
jgi:hypothetical protein